MNFVDSARQAAHGIQAGEVWCSRRVHAHHIQQGGMFKLSLQGTVVVRCLHYAHLFPNTVWLVLFVCGSGPQI